MVYLLYVACLFFVPLQALMNPGIVMLITFTFFVSICLCILYFKTDNTFKDALSASALATVFAQFANLYAFQVLQHEVNKPLHALICLCFFGALFSIYHFTKLGSEKSMITAGFGIFNLWGTFVLLKAGAVNFLFGQI